MAGDQCLAKYREHHLALKRGGSLIYEIACPVAGPQGSCLESESGWKAFNGNEMQLMENIHVAFALRLAKDLGN